MIIPKVNESEWRTVFAKLPNWTPPVRRIVVVSPHPDDETLGLGGFIAAECGRGSDVTVKDQPYPKTKM
jgi:hypothetical protein